MKQFQLTEDHVKLIRNFNIWWDDCAYEGAPSVDQKRPFGNSDIYSDIAEILGMERVEADCGEMYWPKGTREKCEKIYRELEIALQVVLTAGSFEPGLYVAENYKRNWQKQ